MILTLTDAQLTQAFVNGFSPACNPQVNTGRFPQVSGLDVTYHCDGTAAVVDSIAKTATGAAVTVTASDTVRFVTNDFMYTGGDGYTVFSQGTDVVFPGNLLLDVFIDAIKAQSPISAAVEGRLIKT